MFSNYHLFQATSINGLVRYRNTTFYFCSCFYNRYLLLPSLRRPSRTKVSPYLKPTFQQVLWIIKQPPTLRRLLTTKLQPRITCLRYRFRPHRALMSFPYKYNNTVKTTSQAPEYRIFKQFFCANIFMLILF